MIYSYLLKKIEICKFADDNTLYACDISVDTVKNRLVPDTERLVEWFKVNSLVVNPKKFQVMFLGVINPVGLNINSKELFSETQVKLS